MFTACSHHLAVGWPLGNNSTKLRNGYILGSGVAGSVECFLSMNETLDLIPRTKVGMVVHACNPGILKVEAEEEKEHKVIHSSATYQV